jgi:hypothetical protein
MTVMDLPSPHLAAPQLPFVALVKTSSHALTLSHLTRYEMQSGDMLLLAITAAGTSSGQGICNPSTNSTVQMQQSSQLQHPEAA